ncbi:MAG: hypothetical protein RR922_03115 [Clostridia bacterium]
MNNIKISWEITKKLLKNKSTYIAIIFIIMCFGLYTNYMPLSKEYVNEFYTNYLYYLKGPTVLCLAILPVIGIFSILIYIKIAKSKEIISRINTKRSYITIQILTNIFLVTIIYIVSIIGSILLTLIISKFYINPPDIILLPYVDLQHHTERLRMDPNLFIFLALFKWYMATIAIQMFMYIFCVAFKSKVYSVGVLALILVFIENASSFTTGSITDKLLIHFYLGFDVGFAYKNISQLVGASVIYFSCIFVISIILIYIISKNKDVENDARY